MKVGFARPEHHIVLMYCKVNFHVVRSALQNSMFLLCTFLQIRSSIDPTFCGIYKGHVRGSKKRKIQGYKNFSRLNDRRVAGVGKGRGERISQGKFHWKS